MYNHPNLLAHMVESKRNELINESNALRTYLNKSKLSLAFSKFFLSKKQQSTPLTVSCCNATK
jgi:hypothetical protein